MWDLGGGGVAGGMMVGNAWGRWVEEEVGFGGGRRCVLEAVLLLGI